MTARKRLSFTSAFGATEVYRIDAPGGKIGHAELKINDSMIMLADETPRMGTRSPKSVGASTVGIFLYVKDVDSVFAQATQAGAQVEMPVADQFWGDRYGKLTDPFGHSWSLATHIEDVAPEEMKKRAAAAMSKMAEHSQGAS